MNKQTTENTAIWVTIEEAIKRCKYSKSQIKKLYEKGNERIRAKKSDDRKHILVNLIDIWQYESAHPEKTILNTGYSQYPYISYNGCKLCQNRRFAC